MKGGAHNYFVLQIILGVDCVETFARSEVATQGQYVFYDYQTWNVEGLTVREEKAAARFPSVEPRFRVTRSTLADFEAEMRLSTV